ncbi:MAG: carboxypeptidase-like regulatory domain-containing protein [Bryobacteraceae bacterium]
MKRISICVFLSGGVLFAQSETGKASLEGRVSDPSGQSIQAASVKVLETQTGIRRDATTNAEGQFRVGALQVGTYQVEASAPAFGTARVQGITLTVGETKSVNVILQVASLTSEVTVSTDAQIVDQSDPSDSVTINSRAVEDLPIRGRNFTEFVQLSPNVMQEQDRFGIVVNGQRSINSNIWSTAWISTIPSKGASAAAAPTNRLTFSLSLRFANFRWCATARRPKWDAPTPASSTW